MNVRRVVTGQRADGTSVFVSDEQVEPVTVSLLPGATFHRLWASDAMVQLPTDGTAPDAPRYFPPAGGFRFGVFTLGPDTVTASEGIDFGAALAEVARKLPGLADSMEPAAPGMHTTDTIDYDFVLSGEVWLELDNGAQVHLRAGDCVVQNGTRHAWRNKSAAPCVLAFALVGARRAG
jgi:mannose-6-phosphate isomerase-like protein (cupin superfamily)